MTEANSVSGRNLQIGLLLLRLTTGAFFLVWAVDKIVNPDHALRVFEKFYFTSITPEIALALGVAQILIILAFMAGLWKAWTTLALLAMHTVSVGSTWMHLLNPYSGGPGLVFWAAVPVWAGLLLLWLARSEDRLWSAH